MIDIEQKSVSQHLDDQELVQLIVSGKHFLFNELVARYEAKIFHYALRMCGNQADAEDIFQETFLHAFRALKSFRGHARFVTWLYRIANNSCLMKRRKSKFAPEQELSWDDLGMIPGKEREIVTPTLDQSPFDHTLNHEFRTVLQSTLLELPKLYRQVFILSDLQGFRNQEISDMLDISVATVKSRLHRARLFLREHLAGYLNGGL